MDVVPARATPLQVANTAQSATRRGRPRDTGTDAAIRQAALELLAHGGPDACTIEAISARSGVAKTTIYRRWPGVDDLLVDAMSVAFRSTPDRVAEIQSYTEKRGSTLRGAARQILSLLREPLFRSAFPVMARILLSDTPLADQFRAQVFLPLRSIRSQALRAELDAANVHDVDPDLLLDLVNGALIYRLLIGAPIDEEVADSIARLIESTWLQT